MFNRNICPKIHIQIENDLLNMWDFESLKMDIPLGSYALFKFQFETKI